MVFSLSPLLLAIGFLGASATDTTASLPRSVVGLGTAADFAILSKAGVSTTSGTSVTGNVGTSPIAATAITGFSLSLDSTTKFSTSSLVTGVVYAADYSIPTPSEMTTAIGDMETAYTDAAGRVTPDFIELGTGNMTGRTLTPGLYKWGTSVGFNSSLTFDGSAEAVWILQIAGDLNVGSGAIVTLAGGALAENIFWQVAGSTVLGTIADMEGIILCATSIIFETGSSLTGAALSQTSVTLDAATVVKATVSV